MSTTGPGTQRPDLHEEAVKLIQNLTFYVNVSCIAADEKNPGSVPPSQYLIDAGMSLIHLSLALEGPRWDEVSDTVIDPNDHLEQAKERVKPIKDYLTHWAASKLTEEAES